MDVTHYFESLAQHNRSGYIYTVSAKAFTDLSNVTMSTKQQIRVCANGLGEMY